MRKIVILSTVFLALSGIGLHYRGVTEALTGYSILYTLHIWVGIFFIVIFPMYSWDHIKNHQRRLKNMTWVSTSGTIQFVSGMGLILTGIILLLYGGESILLGSILLSSGIHFWATFLLGGSLLLHYIIKK